MVNLFESMGSRRITWVDPMDEAVIQESYKKHQEGKPGGTNQTDRANVYATFKRKTRAEKACYLTVILTLCRRRWKTAGRTRRLSR